MTVIADQIDEALRQITPFAGMYADQILDLREAALAADNPGRCVRCYFSIYQKAGDELSDRLLPLRKWLENHIEIVARDATSHELERVPVILDGKTLEEFCEEVMEGFHKDRAYETSRIALSFQFREAAAA